MFWFRGREVGRWVVASAIGSAAVVAFQLLLPQIHVMKPLSSELRSTGAEHLVLLILAVGATLLLLAANAALREGRGNLNSALLAAVAIMLVAVNFEYLHVAISLDRLTPSDALLLAAYALSLVALLRQNTTNFRGEDMEAAVIAERKRIARDLHDGLAQDLVFIQIYAQRFDSEFGSEHPLIVASKRALDVTRGAIVDLSAASAATTEEALRLVARKFESRFDVGINVQVSHDAVELSNTKPSGQEREEIIRVVSEAIVNAVRHGGARVITVELDARNERLRLVVTDDGCGISEPATTNLGEGFGLPTMRAHAESFGGRLTARPGACGGTELEVLISRASSDASPTSNVTRTAA
ncbi:MAG: sensor histidine kinase [Solirubrobacteraceae bacterium]